jgi:hypothetical protein
MREKYPYMREWSLYTRNMTDAHPYSKNLRDALYRPHCHRHVRPPLASEALEDRERVDPDFDAFDCAGLVRHMAGLDRPGMTE